MTHKPPVPDAQTPPWPATPAPQAHAQSDAESSAPAKEEGDSWPRVDARLVAGIAVGSAAVAAALLFAGRATRPKSAVTAPSKAGVPRPEAED